MSIRTCLAVVSIAETDVALHRAGVKAAWRGFKQQSERAATPGRIIGAGLITGFLSGLRQPGTGAGASLGGKAFGLLLNSAFASFSAAMAAETVSAHAQHDAGATAPIPPAKQV
jgi:hypothetical protein